MGVTPGAPVAEIVEVDLLEQAATAVDATGAQGGLTPLIARPVALMGLVIVASGAAGTVVAYNGEAGTGAAVLAVQAAANGADTKAAPHGGVYCPGGLSVALTGAPTKASALVRFIRRS